MTATNARLLIRRLLAVLMLAGVFVTPAGAAQPNPADAQALVEDISERVLAVLEQHSGEGEMDVEQVRKELSDIIMPHMDFVTMTRLAVGRNWREASDDQKRTLVNEFRDLLVRTYTQSLDQYSGQQVELLPLRESPHEDRVKVRSRVTRPDGPPIPVEYGLHYDDGEWKLYDIVVEGISLVTTYRSNFSSIVQRSGVAGLIEELQRKNSAGETAPDAPGSES